MNEKVILAINSIIIMSVFIVIRIILLNSSKKDIYIGVKIPPEERYNEEIKKIGRRFISANLYSSIPLMIILGFLIYKMESIYAFDICIFIFISVNFAIYYIYNKKVKELKEKREWMKGKKQVVTIDTKYSKEKNRKVLPSSVWFLIPVIILIMNIILNFKYYPDLPSKVATQWNFSGKVTCYQDKSMKLIFHMPKIQFFMIVVTFISFKVIGWAKQEISSINPEESIKNNIVFRRVWGIYTIFTCIIMTLVFTLGNFQIMKIVDIQPQVAFIFTFSVVTLISIIALIISIKIGQGGSKLSSNKNKDKDKDKDHYVGRDDDRFWKFGNTIYYNPNDPSVFIEKRFGIGWTINAGNKIGLIIYIGALALIVISLITPFISRKL